MDRSTRALLLDAFESGWIAPLGPHVDAFEREVAERVSMADGAALVSGTAALHLALRLLGVGPGDTVLAPTATFIASVSPAVQLGAEVVFIDSLRSSWNIDPQLLEDELGRAAAKGKLPKAVVVVDLYGQCADYEAIEPLCARYEVPIVADAAESLGATFLGRPAGSFGAMSVLSFNGNKIITTSGGGMLLSNNREWVRRARTVAAQAREPEAHYEHVELGYNYRLSNLLAAIGRGQLQTLDERVARRREHFEVYRAALQTIPGIDFMPEDPRGRCNRWLSCITIDPIRFGVDREALRRHLETQNIESRPLWKPMHMQPVFQGARCCGGEVAEALFANGLCLPSGSNMSDEQRAGVITAIFDLHCKSGTPGGRATNAA